MVERTFGRRLLVVCRHTCGSIPWTREWLLESYFFVFQIYIGASGRWAHFVLVGGRKLSEHGVAFILCNFWAAMIGWQLVLGKFLAGFGASGYIQK
jgi:hypothetical protein